MNNIYTLKETAELLKTSVKTTQRLIDAKELNAFKLGSQWRIAESSINEYVESMLAGSKKKKKAIVGNDLHITSNAMPINTLERVIEQSENKEIPEIVGNNKVVGMVNMDELLRLNQSGLTYNQVADKLNENGSLTATGRAWTKKSVEHQISKAKKELVK